MCDGRVNTDLETRADSICRTHKPSRLRPGVFYDKIKFSEKGGIGRKDFVLFVSLMQLCVCVYLLCDAYMYFCMYMYMRVHMYVCTCMNGCMERPVDSIRCLPQSFFTSCFLREDLSLNTGLTGSPRLVSW